MYDDVIEWLSSHLFTCYFKSHGGIECPGCGMQRAFISLLKGDFFQSLNYNAGLIPFITTIIALIVQLKIKKESGAKYVMWLFIVTVIVTSLQYIVKQIWFFNAIF